MLTRHVETILKVKVCHQLNAPTLVLFEINKSFIKRIFITKKHGS